MSDAFMFVVGILYALLLFCVFAALVCSPFALMIWAGKKWYACHTLSQLPWHKRKIALGIAFLWRGLFTKRSRRARYASILAGTLVLFGLFVFSLKFVVCTWTVEDSIVLDLQSARQRWLRDDCPRPIPADRYLPTSSSFTGFVYTNVLTVKDPDLEKRTLGMSKEQTCRGLFALRYHPTTNTYIVTMTGEIIVMDGKGGLRLRPDKHGYH